MDDKTQISPATSHSASQVDWAPKEWFESQIDGQDPSDAGSYFGHSVSGYQQFRHRELLASLATIKDELKTEAMLDVGCATGELTKLIKDDFGFTRATGTDFLDEIIAVAKKRHKDIDFSIVALPKLPFPDNSYDLIVASEVLYYLTPEARKQALLEIERVLKPDGYLLFTAVLGEQYFSLESARALVQDRFRIRTERCLRMGLYHRLVGLFELLARVLPMLEGKASPGTAASQAKLKRWQPILASTPVTFLIKVLANITKPLLRNSSLPQVLQAIPIMSGPRTNIILVSQLRSNSKS